MFQEFWFDTPVKGKKAETEGVAEQNAERFAGCLKRGSGVFEIEEVAEEG